MYISMLSITKGHYINVWLQDQWTVEAVSVLQCLQGVQNGSKTQPRFGLVIPHFSFHVDSAYRSLLHVACSLASNRCHFKCFENFFLQFWVF